MSERALTNRILKTLNALPQSRALKMHGSRWTSGWPDILWCFRGRAIWIEVKIPGNRMTPRQVAISHQLRDAGCAFYVAFSMDDLRTAINEQQSDQTALSEAVLSS